VQSEGSYKSLAGGGDTSASMMSAGGHTTGRVRHLIAAILWSSGAEKEVLGASLGQWHPSSWGTSTANAWERVTGRHVARVTASWVDRDEFERSKRHRKASYEVTYRGILVPRFTPQLLRRLDRGRLVMFPCLATTTTSLHQRALLIQAGFSFTKPLSASC
jgi:hypothetical protein